MTAPAIGVTISRATAPGVSTSGACATATASMATQNTTRPTRRGATSITVSCASTQRQHEHRVEQPAPHVHAHALHVAHGDIRDRERGAGERGHQEHVREREAAEGADHAEEHE